MQTKHTPGPWAVESDTDIVSDSGDFVASCHEPGSDVSTAREYANARLIAAAPDLLAALRHLLEDAVALNMGESDRSGVLVEARAAIAKATGGQP